MRKHFIWGWGCLMACLVVQAQVPQYNYFPAPLCKTEGVKIVTVYETQVDDPAKQAGHGNRIRLARNMVRQSYYDASGLAYRSLRYANEGKAITTEIERTFNNQQLLITELQRQYNTNLIDSTKLLQSARRTLQYQGSILAATVTALINPTATKSIDSIAYVCDANGQLQMEAVYDLHGAANCILQKQYSYDGSTITVVTKVSEQQLNRDEFVLDAKGRVVQERNYGPGDDTPRLESVYVYDPRGWLEEIRYSPNWQHFTKDVTVVSRKNKYDDHGKLVETQLDYGSGKRLFEFIDYTYWVEN
jgi:hypothetical protein